MYENLGQHIRERIQTCHPKGKTYRNAQLGELVHFITVEQLAEHELSCESEPAWERGEGEAVAQQQPPRVSGCEATTSSQGRRIRVVEALLPEKTSSPPSWRAKCRCSFVTLPPMPLQEQPVVILLLQGALVTWSLATDECGGHGDLCGSGHLSVIPYIHGRTELYCGQVCLA
jgi:hypothetical protein